MAEEIKPDRRVLDEPLPVILAELGRNIEVAKTAAKEAREAADEAKEASKQMPKEFARKVISSWEFLSLLIVAVLATIVASVAISLGIALSGR
jgi:uncharacterized membrane protein